MTNRAVIFMIFAALLALGLGLFLWVTGSSLSLLADRAQIMWHTATMAIRKSSGTQNVMVICTILIVTGVVLVAKSIRRV